MARQVLCGDWGNTQLRLFCLGEGAPRGVRTGKGVGFLERDEMVAHLRETAGDWWDTTGDCPVLLSGAIGSNVGLFDAGYVSCPASMAQMSAQVTRQRHLGREISILAGLSCDNAFGLPDRLRGEEAELMGWMGARPRASQQAQLVCLPGTHTKWAVTVGQEVSGFTTMMTGEAYALFAKDSILVHRATEPGENMRAFDEGVDFALRAGVGGLLSTLFAVRSAQIAGAFDPAAARSHVSGVMIGADVLSATNAYADVLADGGAVTVIGGAQLAKRYERVLNALGFAAICEQSEAHVRAGLGMVAAQIGLL